MIALIERGLVSLEPRHIYRIEDASGIRIECQSGLLWVTQERDSRDITLGKGQSLTLDRAGLAVVYALEKATFSVATPEKDRRGMHPVHPVPQIRAA